MFCSVCQSSLSTLFSSNYVPSRPLVHLSLIALIVNAYVSVSPIGPPGLMDTQSLCMLWSESWNTWLFPIYYLKH